MSDRLSVRDVQDLVTSFCREYPVVAKWVQFKIRETQEETFGNDARPEKAGRISGAYFPQRRIAAFAAATFRNQADVRRSLRHEIVGHFGLNTFSGEEKRRILNALIASRNARRIDRLWDAVTTDYPHLDQMGQAEEVYALACEFEASELEDSPENGQRAFQEIMRRTTAPMTWQDLKYLTDWVAEGLHDGTRAPQNFPVSDRTQFRIEDDAGAGPVKGATNPVNNPGITSATQHTSSGTPFQRSRRSLIT